MTLIALPQNALCLKTDIGYAVAQRKLIDEMCERIAKVGLLNPLIVTKEKGRFLVVDGKKRFHAIKKLARTNKLPRSLHKVPCFLSDKDPLSAALNTDKPMLLTEQDLAHAIITEDDKGASYREIGALFDCSDKIITQARSLSRLNPKLMLAFINNTINLAQAAALSTVPNKDAQWDLLVKLGPFATEPQIIEAIANGDTVIELPDGEIMILPSRAHKATFKPAFIPTQQDVFQLAA